MPYQVIYDNLPIDGLESQIELVNNQVDLNTLILDSAIGTQGTLANRLNQSINDDGSLKTIAIDNALHNIAEHLDGNGYVRMTLNERTKLSLIADDATKFILNINTISGIIPFINTEVNVNPSDSITWRYQNGNVYADTAFPAAVRHTHYYGLTPVTSNSINYTTTSIATAYRQGSLRVYINGIRLNSATSVQVPFSSGSIWKSFTYTEGIVVSGIVTGGNFSLNVSATGATVIIDFDVLF